jgi:hypothetical protein
LMPRRATCGKTERGSALFVLFRPLKKRPWTDCSPRFLTCIEACHWASRSTSLRQRTGAPHWAPVYECLHGTLSADGSVTGNMGSSINRTLSHEP